MNKRDFLKLVGAAGVGLAAPKAVNAEESEDDFHDRMNIGDLEFGILPAGDGPADIVFNDGQAVPFLAHPRHLLVMCETEVADDGTWGDSWIHYRPIQSLELNHVLREIGFLCMTRFSIHEVDTDYDMDSGPERLDEERIARELEEKKRKREYDAMMEKVVLTIDSALKAG